MIPPLPPPATPVTVFLEFCSSGAPIVSMDLRYSPVSSFSDLLSFWTVLYSYTICPQLINKRALYMYTRCLSLLC